jgi:hypothetical protein
MPRLHTRSAAAKPKTRRRTTVNAEGIFFLSGKAYNMNDWRGLYTSTPSQDPRELEGWKPLSILSTNRQKDWGPEGLQSWIPRPRP